MTRLSNFSTTARACRFAGTLISLALLAGLSIAASSANAAFPGLNGKIACGGPLATEVPDPPPPGQFRIEIFDINPDATGERRLTQDTASDASPRYSADGEKIVFNKNNQIWTMNADGSNPQGPLTSTTDGSNSAGSWSPDGTQIAFQSTRNAGAGFSFDVYKMDADGSNQTRLTADPAEDSLPSWSPDGKKIVFNSRRGGSPDLWVINPDGNNPTQLTNFPGEEAAAQWSPDGNQLVFHSDLAVFPRPTLPRNLEIYRMNADGSGAPTRLTFSDYSASGDPNTDFTGFDLFPAWSPEGDQIVFHSGRAQEFRNTGFGAANFGQWEVYRIDAVKGDGLGGTIVRLTNRAGNDERCNWQPLPRPAASRPVVQPPVSLVPTPTAAKLKTSLTLKAKPKRARRLPFKYRFTGRVRIPAGISKPAVCSGRVRLRLRKGGNTVAKGTAKVSKSCTYKKKITIRTAKKTGKKKGKLKVTATFGGTTRLKSSTKTTTVRFF